MYIYDEDAAEGRFQSPAGFVRLSFQSQYGIFFCLIVEHLMQVMHILAVI